MNKTSVMLGKKKHLNENYTQKNLLYHVVSLMWCMREVGSEKKVYFEAKK